MSALEFIAENKKRLATLFAEYDPLTGIGSPIDRFSLTFYVQKDKPITNFLPLSMKNEPIVLAIIKNPDLSQLSNVTFGGRVDCLTLFMMVFKRVRFKHDFEFWAFLTAKIQDKLTKKIIPFRERLAQRMLLKELEEMRITGVPIRLILLKARQYGGSTLIQMYMLWIQTELKENWHSAVCAVDEGQSRNIRGMYTRAVREYPKGVGTITLIPHEGSSKNKVVAERGCIIGIGSMQMPDNLRSYDFSMLHLSEVGMYKETLGKKPEDLVQTLRSALPNIPMTLEVLESTAKGVGNFFHREWLDAKNKVSGYKAIFIPWYMIDLYLRPIEDYAEFIKTMAPYDLFQWQCGATLEGINWYKRFKADNRYSTWRMQAEFPTTCVAKGMRIGTEKGIIPIEDCFDAKETGTGIITNHMNNGTRPVFKLKTKMGYEIRCTEDHLIKILPQLYNKEWERLDEISIGDIILLSPPKFSNTIFTYRWSEDFVNHSIEITPDLARFLGIFMGDGSYSGQTISIACDARDVEFIEDTRMLVNKLFNVNSVGRLIGKNKGCCELRVKKLKLTEYFLRLGIIYQYKRENKLEGGLGYNRKICVPDAIWRSPKHIVREFLKGIFETDGYAGGTGTPVIGLFSKYIDFLKDVQLLLLGFGITSSIHSNPAVNGSGYKYMSNKLALLGEQADLYQSTIGFLSRRKIEKLTTWKIKNIKKRTKNNLYDSVVSIESDGKDAVFDLTIDKSHEFSANGILVHNCLEAFSSTGSRVFAPEYVQNMRHYCQEPEMKGQLFAKGRKGKEAFVDIEFKEVPEGDLWIWAMPDRSVECQNRYVVACDVGGRSMGADYSTVRVLDRYWSMYGGADEIVASWKNHIDQDLFAWIAAQIAKFYNDALFIMESNSLRKDTVSTEGSHYLTILDEIAEFYDNIYTRTSPDKVRGQLPVLYGLHMGSNKTMIIDALNAALRDQTYIERDSRVLDECDTYEVKPDGTLGSVDSCHDDLVMATAMDVWACGSPLAIGPCKEVDKSNAVIKKKIVSEASL